MFGIPANKANRKKKILLLVNVLVMLIVFYLMIGRNLITKEPPDLTSFAFTAFAGYLFFLLIPVEVMFIYFASAQSPNLVMLVSMTVILAMSAQSIDYSIGRLASNRLLRKLIGHGRYKKFKRFLNKHGYLILFLFNVLPLSSPILILMTGMFHYPFRKVFTYSAAGLLIKYSAIAIFLSLTK
jgi:membrane protein DedA with SNARE-associated domain